MAKTEVAAKKIGKWIDSAIGGNNYYKDGFNYKTIYLTFPLATIWYYIIKPINQFVHQ